MKKIIISIILAVLLVVSTNSVKSEAASGAWKISHGQWWYEYSDGSYAHNEYVDGYWLDGAGWYDSAWNGSWKTNSSGWWFQSGSWYPTAQWLKIDGKWYYFKASGYMASNEWVGNYYLKSSGAMAKDEWIGEYYVGSDGAWVQNKKKTPTKEVSKEEDHGENVVGNTYYGHYETEDIKVYGYRAYDGTFFEDCDACADYADSHMIGYGDAEKVIGTRLIWKWNNGDFRIIKESYY